MEMTIKTVESSLFAVVKTPLAVRFDENDLSFTVDMTHEHADRLLELTVAASRAAEKPVYEYEGETHDERVNAATAVMDSLCGEVESLSNKATAHEFAVAFVCLRKASFLRCMSDRADDFIENHPLETECPEYGEEFLEMLLDAAGVKAALMFGYLMGKGICDGWGCDIKPKASDTDAGQPDHAEQQT